MVDTIRKGSNEFYGIYPLPQQMSLVINYISTKEGEVKEKDIVEHLKKDKGNVHKLLTKMVDENLLTKKKLGKSNLYSIP